VTIQGTISPFAIVALGVALAGCGTQPAQPSPETMSLRALTDARASYIDERKDEVIRQLSHCESGGWGPSDRKIYGGRGAYLGRLQFTVRTAQAYSLQRDGVRLSAVEAADLAHDYERASDLAKYMIFDLGEPWHWPLCSKKLGMVAEVRAIRESQEALNR